MLSIYYSKSSGEIYTLTQAECKQGFERFGEFADDMEQILDILYIEDNQYVLSNSHMFKVVDGTLQIKSDVVNINSINNSNK